jgi:hypothetical protein
MAPAQRYDLIQMPLNRRMTCCVALMVWRPLCLFASDDEEKLVRIDSEPAGAHVVINGRDRRTTPFEMKVGHWAFATKKSTAFSKHLSEPWILEVSKDGYRTEKIEMTRGPLVWRSINGVNTYQYWVFNSPSYMVRLRPATRYLTNDDVIRLLKTGLGDNLVIDKIQTSACEFKTDPDDLAKLHESGVSDAVISAMMHAVPADQAGPDTNIKPVKK